MLNRVVLVGRLTKDPELRYTPNGAAVATFTLAVNRTFTNQSGQREADFINCVTWRRQAENVANFLRKGSLAGVDGRLQTRNYENQQGQRVFVTEVQAESVQFLEPKNNNGSSSNHNEGSSGGGQFFGGGPNEQSLGNQNSQGSNQGNRFNDPFANEGKPIDISDDDLPF
ncbi:single-stranded DNA-binding protein SsbA [Bacillus sp. FSL M8-0256]|uniref:single-stranded DNA-binding protein SsbA n=1 Tax=Bacillus TaxID=1386 RepID=UPI0013B8BC33|nr:single-stranded DNA-binding protein SsbA [Bacillus subtilis]KAF2427324.1 single-stranded DNA-binding protein [Bacillus subtilis]MEC0312059.1 single-stranded DNA-binding protein SsbA [Bacillus subtilis]MEC0363633.1 single-stranded DNA-binding protein SsbA [Bacillus subtilis]